MTIEAAPARTVASSLSEVFDPRANALNALRLFLAALVIVAHAWPLSGYGPGPDVGGLNLGEWAVVGFFLISGFLITRSRTRRTASRYAWDRFLRIYPGYVVALAVTAFVLAPLSTLVTGRGYAIADGVSWVVRNLGLYEQHLRQDTIGDTLTGVPLPIWNGPLWSLFFEALCYVAIGVLVAVVPKRALPGVMLAGTVAMMPLAWLIAHGHIIWSAHLYMQAVPPVLAFGIGACAYLFRDLVPVTRSTALVSVLGLVVVIAIDEAPTLGAWALLVPVFWVASWATALHSVGAETDISYGIYIYGWPVQTMLTLVVLERGWDLPVVANIVIVLACTVPLAWLSAALVEQPALRLKGRVG